jgi:hypothetical protein
MVKPSPSLSSLPPNERLGENINQLLRALLFVMRETSFLPMVLSARQGKAKQHRVCMREDWDSFEIWVWWTINLHTQRTKFTNSYNDEQFGFHIQLSRAKPWWAMEGIEWNLVMNKKCLIRGIKNEWDFMATLWSHYDFARYSSCHRSNHLLWYNRSLAIKSGLISISSTSLSVNPHIMS